MRRRLGLTQQIHFGNVVIGPGIGLSFGAGFLVTVADGELKMLEGYSFGEPWPSDTDGLELERAGALPGLDEVISGALKTSHSE